MTEKNQNNVELEEIVFKLNDLTIRVKKNFIRIDTSNFLEAADYHLDFSNADDVRKICKLLKAIE